MFVQIIITIFQFWIMFCEYSIVQEDATNLKFAYIYIYITNLFINEMWQNLKLSISDFWQVLTIKFWIKLDVIICETNGSS